MQKKYNDALEWLNSHINMEAIASPNQKTYKYDIEHLSNWFDQTSYKPQILHIAGTKGKGSVCMMLEKVLRENGYSTGLFTSPHLYQINERVRMQGQPLSNQEFVVMLQTVSDMQKKMPLSFFEIMTIAALRYFEQKKVDWVILETGLGGRLDSTNIVLPFASIITRIDFDHMHLLGNTLDKIAGEKAGIIKQNRPCIALEQLPEVNQVFKEKAKAKQANLYWAKANTQDKENLQVVKKTIEVINDLLQKNILIDDKIQNLRLPGRFEYFQFKDKKIILDVAHNPVSFRFLKEKLEKENISNPIVIAASAKDKDIKTSAEIIQKISDTIYVPALSFPRMASPTQMQEHLKNALTFNNFEEAINQALLSSNQNILITGSFHLIEEAGIFFKRNALY